EGSRSEKPLPTLVSPRKQSSRTASTSTASAASTPARSFSLSSFQSSTSRGLEPPPICCVTPAQNTRRQMGTSGSDRGSHPCLKNTGPFGRRNQGTDGPRTRAPHAQESRAYHEISSPSLS